MFFANYILAFCDLKSNCFLQLLFFFAYFYFTLSAAPAVVFLEHRMPIGKSFHGTDQGSVCLCENQLKGSEKFKESVAISPLIWYNNAV